MPPSKDAFAPLMRSSVMFLIGQEGIAEREKSFKSVDGGVAIVYTVLFTNKVACKEIGMKFTATHI